MPPLPEMKCPVCERVWTPTPFDDCFLPACGCYGTELDRDTPCEKCGLPHGWNCPNTPGHAERTESTTNPKLVEVWPSGQVVHQGRISQEPENRD